MLEFWILTLILHLDLSGLSGKVFWLTLSSIFIPIRRSIWNSTYPSIRKLVAWTTKGNMIHMIIIIFFAKYTLQSFYLYAINSEWWIFNYLVQSSLREIALVFHLIKFINKSHGLLQKTNCLVCFCINADNQPNIHV